MIHTGGCERPCEADGIETQEYGMSMELVLVSSCSFRFLNRNARKTGGEETT